MIATGARNPNGTLKQGPALAQKKKKKDAEDTGVPKLGTVLEMPTLNSASVAAAEEAALLAQSKRRGRLSTLLSDPNEQPLGARDTMTETVLARDEAARIKAEELKKKKLVSMGLYTSPATILGG